MDPSITILYFAQLRERAGRAEEQVALEPSDTPARVYQRLTERHGFALRLRDLRVAINDDFAEIDTLLRSRDRLVFIPPVAGG